MRIEDDDLLREFRFKDACEWCNLPAHRFPLEPHHVFSKGAGRLDIRINLIALCFLCHNDVHSTREITREDLLAKVAAREQTTQDAIREEVYRLRRT